jgi:hypothetical protein
MAKEPETREGGERRPTKRQYVSLEGAALTFAIFSVVNDQGAIDRAAELALRGPEPLSQMARALLLMRGRDPAQLTSGEPDTPPTTAEIRGFAEPNLRKGATLAGFAQLASIYLLDESSTPEEVITVLYILLRLLVCGNREPSGEEGKQIWAAVVELAPHAKIVAPRWKEYEERGRVHLEDWLDEIKERASSKFKTFLRRIKRIEENTDRAFKNLTSLLVGEGDEPA